MKNIYSLFFLFAITFSTLSASPESTKGNSSQISITILFESGRDISIVTFTSDAVQQLKQKIQDEFDISLARQTLFFNGTQLIDGYTLFDYNIQEGDTLNLLLQPFSNPNHFITTWKTDNPGGANNSSIDIAINPALAGSYNYDVSWKNDGVWETGFTGNAFHDYGTPGIYTVAIRGTFPSFQFYRGMREKIIAIEQWGNNVWSTMEAMFRSCPNLTYNATDAPNLSLVTSMAEMFVSAPLVNGNLSNWDTSNVENIQDMFGSATSFNGAIGNWNVGNVTNMFKTFNGATSFNQNLNNWNTSNVTNMQETFKNATSFNGAISNWNVGNVTTMRQMFLGASSFNQNLNWNPSNVVDMYEMFKNATLFNGAIGNWGVGNVTNMQRMFYGASSFNQNLNNWNTLNVVSMWEMFKKATLFNGAIGNWNVGNVTTMQQMFQEATSFNQNLNNWNTTNVTTMNEMFYGATSFNGAIGNWNVANVADFMRAFRGASSFNQDLNNWNTLIVTNMQEMFRDATSFNGAIDNWNVNNVTNLEQVFRGATAFNQDLSNWNTSSVTSMRGLFQDAIIFNGTIDNWNVSNVTSMNDMFSGATSFDQPLNNWNVSNVTNFYNMFANAGLSTPNYDKTLVGWSNLTLPQGIWFYGGNSTYCMGQSARASIINNYGWNIQDGGKDCSDPCGESTVYSSSGWSNGIPDINKKAIFSSNYNTTIGSIMACGIVIDSGVTLTVAEGTSIQANYNLNINGNLVFLSNSSGNGELAAFGPDGSITGDANINRFMSANRSYRMVSPAVTTTTSINANWQEGVHNQSTAYSQNLNPNPGFGTHITGSTSGLNGLDATQTGNPSLFTVNVENQQFVTVTNTNTNTLTAGEPFLLFVRGDRSIDLNDNNAIPTTTVLRSKGELAFGDQEQNFVSPSAGAFVMAGNPYQSVVDVNFVVAASTNVNPFHYYVYDPTLGDHGAYVTVQLPEGGTFPPSSANQFLQAGQAAQFATLAAGASSVFFSETSKSPGQFTPTHKTSTSNIESSKILGSLYTKENYLNGGSIHDGFGILFGQGLSNALTAEDAIKPMNFTENIGIVNGGTYLSLESRELPEGGEIFPLFVSGYNHSDYVLKMELNGLTNFNVYLDDHFEGTSTRLIEGAIEYHFSIDLDNPQSVSTHRFSVRVGERLNVESNELGSGFELYPNPMGETVTLANPKNKMISSVSIYDLSGRLIKRENLTEIVSELVLDVSQLASATYLVTIHNWDGQEESRLMLKK